MKKRKFVNSLFYYLNVGTWYYYLSAVFEKGFKDPYLGPCFDNLKFNR